MCLQVALTPTAWSKLYVLLLILSALVLRLVRKAKTPRNRVRIRLSKRARLRILILRKLVSWNLTLRRPCRVQFSSRSAVQRLAVLRSVLHRMLRVPALRVLRPRLVAARAGSKLFALNGTVKAARFRIFRVLTLITLFMKCILSMARLALRPGLLRVRLLAVVRKSRSWPYLSSAKKSSGKEHVNVVI